MYSKNINDVYKELNTSEKGLTINEVNKRLNIYDKNIIKEKKKERQIIIVTHNANIVLGADAEEVIIANQDGQKTKNKDRKFEYRSGSLENCDPIKNSAGEIEKGILNSQGIQNHICDILEGGKQAFSERRNKYRI